MLALVLGGLLSYALVKVGAGGTGADASVVGHAPLLGQSAGPARPLTAAHPACFHPLLQVLPLPAALPQEAACLFLIVMAVAFTAVFLK